MAALTPRPATRAELAGLRDLSRAAVRRERGTCLVEGATLLGEALAAGCRPRLVAWAEDGPAPDGSLLERAAAAGAQLVQAPAERLVKLADRRHGPPLLAEVDRPAPADPSCLPASGPALVVVLCGLQDPGNVGTLLRSSRAFGAAVLLALPGTADPWGPKVVRASAGSCFGLPLARLDDAAALGDWSGPAGLETCRAEPPGPDAGPPPAGDGSLLPERCLLLLGHETRGPSGAGRAVAVPQEPAVDSLNVAMAGSILLADWYRAWRA